MIEFELPVSEHTGIDELYEAVGWISLQSRGIEFDLLHFTRISELLKHEKINKI